MKNRYPNKYSTPAGELGLLDGRFPVIFNGRIEYGWTLFNNGDDFVTLTKPDDGGSLYYKMPRTEFYELQRKAKMYSDEGLILNYPDNPENSEQKVQFTEEQITNMARFWFLGSPDNQNVSSEHFNLMKETLDSVFSKLTDEHQIQFALELLNTGIANGKNMPMPMGKYNWYSGFEKALKLIDIYAKNPVLADYLINNQVLGLHCTQSGALPGIVNNGALLSASEANKRGLALNTGERTFSRKGGQKFISFADYYATESIKTYAAPKAEPISLGELKDKLKSTEEFLSDIALHPENHPDWVTPEHPFVYNAQAKAEDLRATIKKIEEAPNSLETHMILNRIPIALGVSAGSTVIKETIYDLDDPDQECFVSRVRSDIQGEFIFHGDELPLKNVKIVFTTKENIALIKDYLKEKGFSDIAVYDINDIL